MPGRMVYEKGGSTPMNDEFIDDIIEIMSNKSSPLTFCLIAPLDGKFAERDDTTTAFTAKKGFLVEVMAMWTPADNANRAKHVEWSKASYDKLSKHFDAIYANFSFGDYADIKLNSKEVQVYGANLPRLQKLKGIYDPQKCIFKKC